MEAQKETYALKHGGRGERMETDWRDERIVELERRLSLKFGELPCADCGGPHMFDTSVPSPLWNRVIRGGGLPEYLCTSCIVRAFVKAGEGFTAQLWGDGFNGVTIEVIINPQGADS